MPERSATPIRWAAKVKRNPIKRLYESDAEGIRDEELVDEVGVALYARCRSILEVTEAVRGRVKCHGCGEIIHRQREDRLLCQGCGWEADWKEYQRSYQERQLFGGAALPFFQEYVDRYLQAGTYRAKLLLIDRLIHEFHWYQKKEQEAPVPVRPTAANLIEGKGIQDVLAFLDTLTHGESRAVNHGEMQKPRKT